VSDLDIARALAEFRALGATRQERSRPTRSAWPPERPGPERKFGAPHARLFPFIGRKVRTPQGAGVLLQVFRGRCGVVLDMEAGQYMRFFPLAEIEPISWLVGDEDFSPKPSAGILEGRQHAMSKRVIDEH
jgi:hypothetical protein